MLESEQEAAADATSCSDPNRFLVHAMDVSDVCVHLCVFGACVYLCVSVCAVSMCDVATCGVQ